MAGEKLKESKKRASLQSAKGESKRDWGSGMACVGRTKECTLVPSNHYGPIPGVEVGTTWLFRVQELNMIMVPSKGVCQQLKKYVKMKSVHQGVNMKGICYYSAFSQALAMNCKAPLNAKTGAKAEDWKKGKPVRVVRSHKLGSHSKYAPEKGNRLRRDDEIPAPWTREGKERINNLGLTIIYPDGYEEAMAVDKKEKTPSRKRKAESPEGNSSKVMKVAAYKLPQELSKLVNKDCNKKLWEECKAVLPEGKVAFLAKVTEIFTCICCQELVFDPVTTKCLHNICKKCLKRSFSAEVNSCPCCRTDLNSKEEPVVNDELSSILKSLFPGYENGR
ncbi:hypothetical protein J437_LFUL012523 [Ladona fulva]|uniref:RING-type domain-containing protein n=1 Tax=Ladona fulva TaxID=123851 RepID=A0A8K0KC78_LADFU|nr:hypothetical protein J437_LFUL012523 [Ladona fulva]